MKVESKTSLIQLIGAMTRLQKLLGARGKTVNSKSEREAIRDVIDMTNHYEEALSRALASEDIGEALRAVNRATTLNKGLSDQGPWMLNSPDIREIGVEVSDQAIFTAKLLRSELGMGF